MPLRTYVAAKLHGVVVTATHLDYHGSVTLGQRLLDALGIQPYEQVHVVNLASGRRWITYALPGLGTVFECNGGGARLAQPGDRCVVMTYKTEEQFSGAPVIQVCEPARGEPPNSCWELIEYRPARTDPLAAVAAVG